MAPPVNGSGHQKKRPFNEGKRHFKKNKRQKTDSMKIEGSNEEVLIRDVRSLLARTTLAAKPGTGSKEEATESALPEPFTEVELTVEELSSTGDGLAVLPDTSQVAVIPFTSPGDRVVAKVVKHIQDGSYTLTDFVRVVSPSSDRDDGLVKCQYFAKCSGCQFQMLPYSYQLAHKKRIIEKAYRNFSTLPESAVPSVADTIGSPLQYGYRTKLTPHFDGPPGGRRDRRNGQRAFFEEVPPIGYMLKGTRKTMDIEDCPIGTDVVRQGMKSERQRVKDQLSTFQRGVTLLLRESTKLVENGEVDAASEPDGNTDTSSASKTYIKECITDQRATSTEYVDGYRFDNAAGSFFQNNNSILPTFTKYVRDHILPKSNTPSQIENLIDAYSGSGLFTITLSPLFKRSVGIDISPSSIAAATRNAELNNLSPDHARFVAGDANDLFASVDFPADKTAVVLDPSRKGCDENFLKQLMKFGPERICYVSCNVHTQARDVGILVGGIDGVNEGKGMYRLESLQGFDFFPQTGHVEGVAVLQKVTDIA